MSKSWNAPRASETFDASSFKPLLKRLVETPEYFTADDLKKALNHLFTPGAVPPEQIGAFLSALHIHRVERRPETLAAAAAVLRERSLKASVMDSENDFIVDIVGTGASHALNIFCFLISMKAAMDLTCSMCLQPPGSLQLALARALSSTAAAHRHLPQAQPICSNLSTACSCRQHRARLCPSHASHSRSFLRPITIQH